LEASKYQDLGFCLKTLRKREINHMEEKKKKKKKKKKEKK